MSAVLLCCALILPLPPPFGPPMFAGVGGKAGVSVGVIRSDDVAAPVLRCHTQSV